MVVTTSASWSGCSRLTGKKPSCRAARRSGLTLPGLSRGPHRHAGALNRSGQKGDAVDGVVLGRDGAPALRTTRRRGSPVTRRASAPAADHRASSPVARQLLAEAIAAETDAEREAAAAEPVQRRGFLGDLGRPAAGKGGDHGAEPEAFGGGGDRGQRDPRVGHLPDRRPPAQVVPHEHAVPAGLLRLGGQPRDHHRVGEFVEDRQPERRRNRVMVFGHDRHARGRQSIAKSDSFRSSQSG